MTRPGEKIKKVFSHPNSLTLYRVACVPAIVILLLYPGRFRSFMAAFLFSAASVTDFLDGYLARRWGLISNLGKIIDPLADKLLVSSGFIMMAALGWVPAWMVCIIIGRELAVTGLRNVIAGSGGDVAASNLGKYKTGFQIAASIPLMIHYPYFGIDFNAIGTVFLWIALIFTIWSGADYFIRFRKLFLE